MSTCWIGGMPSTAPDPHCGLKIQMSAKRVSERAEGRTGLTQQSAQTEDGGQWGAGSRKQFKLWGTP